MEKAISDIKKSISSVNKNKLSYLFLFSQIIILSGCIEQLNNNYTLFVNFIIWVVLNIISKRLKISTLAVVISGAFLLILIPILLYGIESIKTTIGFFMRISIASMIVLYFRDNFFIFFENTIFLLALISLPLYVIQLVHIEFFEIFKNFSELVLSQDRLNLGFGVLSGHRYLILFLVNSWAEKRNSGFGWEPAVFGAILCWAILVNLFINKNSVNVKTIILFISAITTFSIGTYFALLLIYSFFILNQRKRITYFFFGVIITIIISSLSYFSETVERFDRYLVDTKEQTNVKLNQSNRFDAIVFGTQNLFKRPWGYGIRNSTPENIRLPNGFIVLVLQFGILGVLTLLLLLFKLFQVLNIIYLNHYKGGALFVLAIIATLNGNPMSYQEIMFAFILSGFTLGSILKQKELQKLRLKFLSKSIKSMETCAC